MRSNIEPITGSDIANISYENLLEELKFYQTYVNSDFKDDNNKSILLALTYEKNIRDNNIDCKDLSMHDGICKNKEVEESFGLVKCSMLECKKCLAEQIKMFSDI